MISAPTPPGPRRANGSRRPSAPYSMRSRNSGAPAPSPRSPTISASTPTRCANISRRLPPPGSPRAASAARAGAAGPPRCIAPRSPPRRPARSTPCSPRPSSPTCPRCGGPRSAAATRWRPGGPGARRCGATTSSTLPTAPTGRASTTTAGSTKRWPSCPTSSGRRASARTRPPSPTARGAPNSCAAPSSTSPDGTPTSCAAAISAWSTTSSTTPASTAHARAWNPSPSRAPASSTSPRASDDANHDPAPRARRAHPPRIPPALPRRRRARAARRARRRARAPRPAAGVRRCPPRRGARPAHGARLRGHPHQPRTRRRARAGLGLPRPGRLGCRRDRHDPRPGRRAAPARARPGARAAGVPRVACAPAGALHRRAGAGPNDGTRRGVPVVGRGAGNGNGAVARGVPRTHHPGGAHRTLPPRRPQPPRPASRLGPRRPPAARGDGQPAVAGSGIHDLRRHPRRRRGLARRQRRGPAHDPRRRPAPLHRRVPARRLLVARRRRRAVGRRRAGDGPGIRRRRARRAARLRAVDDHGPRPGHPARRAAPASALPPRFHRPRRPATGLPAAAHRRGRRSRPRLGGAGRGRRQRRGRARLRRPRRRCRDPGRGPRIPRSARGPRRPQASCPREGEVMTTRATRPPMARRPWHVRVNALVIAWFLAAAVVVIAHRWIPEYRYLLVHLMMLGGVTTAILIWSTHFAETLLGRPAPGGQRVVLARLGLHTASAIAVIVGVLTARHWLVVAGAVGIGVVAVSQIVALLIQRRGALMARFGGLALYYVAAALNLAIGVRFGTLLAAGGGDAVWQARLYTGHTTTMLLGWVGLTVLVTLVVLWLTMLRTQLAPGATAAARRALVVLLAGLAIMWTAVGTGRVWLVPLTAIAYLIGVGMLVTPMAQVARRKPPASFGTYSAIGALAWLAICLVWLAVIGASATSWGEAQARLGALAEPFVVGFAAQILLGAMSYLAPVMLGGGPRMVKRVDREMNRAAGARVVIVNVGGGLYLLPAPSLVKVTLSLLVFLALGAFLVLLGRALWARFRPREQADDPVVTTTIATGPPPPPRRLGPLAGLGAVALAVVLGVAGDPAAAGLGTAPADESIATGETTRVVVEARDMRFHPDVIEVPTGNRLVIELRNADPDVHDLVLETGAASDRKSVV